MAEHTVDILLVEDNPNDVELALHSFKQHHLANRVQVARDGVEALDFIFGTGPYAARRLHDGPAAVRQLGRSSSGTVRSSTTASAATPKSSAVSTASSVSITPVMQERIEQ
jgi:CheY-like chemotaxis protein